MPPFIQVDNLSYAIPQPNGAPAPILRDISLSIKAGQWVAVVGANGSGKTTLIRHFNAILLPTAGQVQVEGLDTRPAKNWVTIRQWVGMVFQNPAEQIVASVVEDDVAFGPENLGLPPSEVRARVTEALQITGLWEMRDRPAHLLSAGQTQRLALAGVLAMHPRAVIFDEASTMLDPAGRRMVLEQILTLQRRGISVVTVTHAMEEAALAGRVIALDHGRLAFSGTPAEFFTQSDLLATCGLDVPPAARLARRLGAYFPGLPSGILTDRQLEEALPVWQGWRSQADPPVVSVEPEKEPNSALEPIIRVENLEHIYLKGTPMAHLALRGVNLTAAPGQVHGLVGATGSGKSTLLQHLNGLLRPQVGKVRVGPFVLEDPQVAMRAVICQVGLAFQSPEKQFFAQYVGDEIAYGPRQLKLSGSLAERVRRAMQSVGLDFDLFKDRLVYTLSGGEKRKVALASVLALDPSILLLDEPTAGLDPAAHRDLLTRLAEFQSGGKTLVISSHQMEDLAVLAQGLTVFQNGLTIANGSPVDIFNDPVLLEVAGLEAPLAARIAGWLRSRGWPLAAGSVTIESLEAGLAGLVGGNHE